MVAARPLAAAAVRTMSSGSARGGGDGGVIGTSATGVTARDGCRRRRTFGGGPTENANGRRSYGAHAGGRKTKQKTGNKQI